MKFISSYIAFSAPSGAGKTTIVKRLASKYPQMAISISATTRPMRPGEKEGKDYFFLSDQEFREAIKAHEFLEYEEVHGYYYGTLKKSVDSLIKQGKVVLFDIDVKGALSVKHHYPQAVLIFIKPPSRAELIRRLQARRSETEEMIQKRLQRLPFEYEQAKYFDYVVVNDRLNDAVLSIENIIIKNHHEKIG